MLVPYAQLRTNEPACLGKVWKREVAQLECAPSMRAVDDQGVCLMNETGVPSQSGTKLVGSP